MPTRQWRGVRMNLYALLGLSGAAAADATTTARVYNIEIEACD
jgi:hypothetical protein